MELCAVPYIMPSPARDSRHCCSAQALPPTLPSAVQWCRSRRVMLLDCSSTYSSEGHSARSRASSWGQLLMGESTTLWGAAGSHCFCACLG